MRHTLLGIYTYAEFFLAIFGFIPPMALATLRHGKDPGQRIRGRWMRRFGRFTSNLTPLWDFGVEGEPPPDVLEKPYVVVSNHESVSDPFLLSYLPFDMRFIAKEEIFKLPVIGWLMRLSGDISLRRGDKQSVAQMYEECRRTLAAGVPVMVFPEGTRSPDGELLPFKDGAFQMAIESQVPILPVVVAGTRQCRPKGSLWFGQARARVRILPPVPTAGLTAADLPRLREEVRTRIAHEARALRDQLGLSQPPPGTIRETVA
jgi:1-acyl-sn-glycerol-3-phosphate acyltransferase